MAVISALRRLSEFKVSLSCKARSCQRKEGRNGRKGPWKKGEKERQKKGGKRKGKRKYSVKDMFP